MGTQTRGQSRDQKIERGKVSKAERDSLAAGRESQATSRGKLYVHVKQHRRQEREPNANQHSRKSVHGLRRQRIENLRVQRQQRACIEKEEGKAQEEKHALKISLATVAEDHDHPEQHQQRSSRKSNQSNVGKCAHRSWRQEQPNLTLEANARQSPSARFFWHLISICK